MKKKKFKVKISKKQIIKALNNFSKSLVKTHKEFEKKSKGLTILQSKV